MSDGSKKIFFNISLSIALTGFMLYFIQEIILWTKVVTFTMDYGFQFLVVVSDGLMIITIILGIILLFAGFDKVKLFRSVIMMGTFYIFAFTLAHLFVPYYMSNSWTIPSYYGNNILDYYSIKYYLSFIALLLLCLVTLFIFIFSIISMRKEEFTFAEQFSYILILGLMLVFDISCINWVRFQLLGTPFYGFTLTPVILEMILLMAAIVLIAINMANENKRITSILGLILLNIFFFSIISTVVVGTVLDFTYDNDTIPFALGNTFLLVGTVLTFISSVILIKKELTPMPAKTIEM